MRAGLQTTLRALAAALAALLLGGCIVEQCEWTPSDKSGAQMQMLESSDAAASDGDD